MTITRRDFARRSALTGASVALVGSVGALATAPGALAADDAPDTGDAGDEAGTRGHGPGYGPLVPDPEGILALPAGFSYRIITHSGVTTLESGEYTPSNHDGTAAFEGPRGTTLLVNNHELKGVRSKWKHPVPLTEGLVYDPAASGGCTVVEVHRGGEVAEWVGIAGTSTNCAGGSTSWGTWLTCEENSDRAGQNGMTKDHGYVFEVDPYDRRANLNPKPVKAFGRFDHEAVVIDPKRGHAYLTEDDSEPNGLLFRWVPPHGFKHGRGQLRRLADDAGTLQAPKCFDSGGRFVDDLSRATRIGTVYGVDWIDVPDRDGRTVPVREQFDDGDITRARKLEGMWWADGGAYIVSSYARDESPGEPHDGQVWFYDPRRRTLTLKVLIGTGGQFDGPDNITVSPYGGLVLAEDGDGGQHLFGATESGRTYPIARNELNVGTDAEPQFSEFAGVVFSPDGKTLYANIQNPGILLAITGPWRRRRPR
ncbi:Tat pathway signal sequence domain protein [Streptomyces agglomeratus]|uniref:Tat pathway signal sequence domain protein n=1 Tax=Streptomyces agglomeratus TaxID=285458 RepID=A0A1E5PD51_9ACTN|nr:alkaline phosphatase PhoX [Streptomyces agglomeratus]OEJ27471.1 Tat pathway signal sequence domain protein [Streptomyces agglomeratus]OEJ38472.1 Tat pathway signal sequence domain protein [Streptomyces agglomeratus]OEJ47143.1 Tat pathway signal sequence domain protein [Streptomyces agglomeratus]OEJ51000.1 Tat pathway signal sequence domain protein [Streptomyces agglomeratus]OEJ58370.1 Tat pathway signal sequence domain protein [Streptomyces agglomeratus]